MCLIFRREIITRTYVLSVMLMLMWMYNRFKRILIRGRPFSLSNFRSTWEIFSVQQRQLLLQTITFFSLLSIHLITKLQERVERSLKNIYVFTPACLRLGLGVSERKRLPRLTISISPRLSSKHTHFCHSVHLFGFFRAHVPVVSPHSLKL